MTKVRAIIKLLRPQEMLLLIPLNIGMLLLATMSTHMDIKIVLLFLCAISAGYMAGDAVNGLTDIEIDSLNPRTLNRPLASGAISILDGMIVAAVCLAIVVICTYFINPLYILLLPIPIGIGVMYCLSKRFTALCHFILGITAAVGPFAAWIVFSEWRDIRAFICGAIAVFHISSYDLLYSIQDIEYDKQSGMHSIPARYGKQVAVMIAIFCNIVMFALLFSLKALMDLGTYFSIGMWIMALLSVIQVILAEKDKGRLAFELNFIYDTIFMIFIIFDRFF